jgi:hypothetical protein
VYIATKRNILNHVLVMRPFRVSFYRDSNSELWYVLVRGGDRVAFGNLREQPEDLCLLRRVSMLWWDLIVYRVRLPGAAAYPSDVTAATVS